MDRSSLASVLSLPEGTFLGNARHKDGSLMAIVFQVSGWIKGVCVNSVSGM